MDLQNKSCDFIKNDDELVQWQWVVGQLDCWAGTQPPHISLNILHA